MNKWIAEFDLEDGDTMPEHMDLNYMGAKIDFHCRPMWIPCKERLPEPRIDVWCNSDMGQMVGYYDEYAETWYGRDYLELIVTAWMSLPEPYREERTEE